MKQNKTFSYLMSLPTVLILAFLTVFPLGFTIFYSFTNFNMLKPKALKFIGLANYTKIISDPYFQQALGNTLKFMVLAVILETGIGLLVAVLINSLGSGQKLLRTLLLLPVVLPPVTVALIWQIMLSNNYGIINKMLESVGAAPVNWLNDVRTAFYCILAIDVWQYMPFAFLLIYASLQSVPETQYEAAQMDGANAVQRFWYVTLPNIMNGIVLVILLRSIDSIRLFDKVNILTRGGPANSTATITQYIYNYGVGNYKIGFSSAGSIVMTLIVLLISSLYIKKAFQRN
ncbi:MAG: carbohydrate ABC transporter permease [Flexilinea sp.]